VPYASRGCSGRENNRWL